MTTSDTQNSGTVLNPNGGAERYEPSHSDDEMAMENIDMEPGDAIRLASERTASLEYYVRVGDLFLHITKSRVTQVSPKVICYDRCHAGDESEVPMGEPFAYLHADEDEICIEKQYGCISCGSPYNDWEKSCSCPVGGKLIDAEIPEVPRRPPRKVIDGEAVVPASEL